MHQMKSAYDRIQKLESVGAVVEEKPAVQKDTWSHASEMMRLTQTGDIAMAVKK